MQVVESPEYEAVAIDKSGIRIAVCPHGLNPQDFLSWEPCEPLASKSVAVQQGMVKRIIATVRVFGVRSLAV